MDRDACVYNNDIMARLPIYWPFNRNLPDHKGLVMPGCHGFFPKVCLDKFLKKHLSRLLLFWHVMMLMWRDSNYANPVYGVATICHQVRCLRWGHPRLFHTATSLLIWYKMFCMRDISYRPTWMKFINMLSVYTQPGTHRRVHWWIITVLT